jgi:gamma-glutamyltranspeptidase/glutathione hydrolase
MSPTLVFKDGKPFPGHRQPGGSRIITTTLQVIILNVDRPRHEHRRSHHAARIHHQWLPDEIRIEEGLSPDTVRLLEERGHKLAVKNAMGSTQSIHVDTDKGLLLGASDPRRTGSATVGY